MRVVFAYLPVPENKGFLCLSQNRFAHYRGNKELIYPVIPATGVTMWQNARYDTTYIDSIYESLKVPDFLKRLEKLQPDLLVFETKTPIVKQNWLVANEIKKMLPELKIAAAGDHVSVLPNETLENSDVDYVLTGGDFDISMLKLADYISKGTEPPMGLYYKENGQIKNTGPYELIKDLDLLPFIDRGLVPWEHYHESWRLHDRFMYMMASRGCPYRCSFCSWPQMLYHGKTRWRSVSNVLDEIEMLEKKYTVEEIFFDDDTFTANKKWVIEFSKGLIEKGIDIVWDCNGRVDNVNSEMLKLMKKSGCRLIKFGIESANQNTLDRIKKGYALEEVRTAFRHAKEAGIMRHGTVMLGYPWETEEDLQATIDFVKELDVDTVQFSIPIVYPGTELFDEAVKNNWLTFPPGDWEHYDMAAPTLRNENLKPERIVEICDKAWNEVYFRPTFILNKLFSVRGTADLKLLVRGAKSVLKWNE